MIDLDRVLEAAAHDVRSGVERIASGDASAIARRARRHSFVAAAAAVIAIALVGGVVVTAMSPRGPVAPADGESIVNGEQILEDGVVTEEEYLRAVDAHIACLADAGLEAVAEFDDPSGHASFFVADSEGSPGAHAEAKERCFAQLDFQNVSLGRAAALGQLDLAELQDQEVATVECVEERTGIDFGDPTHDEYGFPTPEGRQTIEAAMDHDDHRVWMSCRNDLGFLAELHAEEQAILDCVEQRTGQDFGDITYDADGFHTPEGQSTLREAVSYQDDEPWNACERELGVLGTVEGRTGDS